MGVLNCLSCGLKDFFDKQRVDIVGKKLVRFQKSLILQFFTRAILQLSLMASVFITPVVNQAVIASILIPLLISPALTAISLDVIQNSVKRNVSRLRKELFPAYSLCVILETCIYITFTVIVTFVLDFTSDKVVLTRINELTIHQCIFVLWVIMCLNAHVILSIIQSFQMRRIYNLYLLSDATKFPNDDELGEIYNDVNSNQGFKSHKDTFNDSYFVQVQDAQVVQHSPNETNYTSTYYVQPTAPFYQQTSENYVVESLYPVVNVELCEPQNKA
jgi:hypothetical protein